jgi:hypothetical protein
MKIARLSNIITMTKNEFFIDAASSFTDITGTTFVGSGNTVIAAQYRPAQTVASPIFSIFLNSTFAASKARFIVNTNGTIVLQSLSGTIPASTLYYCYGCSFNYLLD